MPTDNNEIIIRNGTWKNFLSYNVVFFGKSSPEYTEIEGGLRVKAKWLLVGVAALGFVLGLVL